MGPGRALGQYLRARRELLRPEDAGLSSGGRRRVPGLRREELALLAGISPDYYLRLEQGRDHHPSVQVIDALASALQLDVDAAAHLHALARPSPDRRPPMQSERVPASIEQLIASWPSTPAFVHGRHLDVLAANPLALALSPAFRPGINLVRAVFLDPELRNLYGDWETVARSFVARLRALVGADVDDPHLGQLVGELSGRSDEFLRLWARHDIEPASARRQVFNHPLVGALELQPVMLAIIGTEGQVLVVRQAEPDSPSERALTVLAGMALGKDGRRSGECSQ
jgi:transcriptional regulator with XRE-family HTH domain